MKNRILTSLSRSSGLAALLGLATFIAPRASCFAQSALSIICPSNIVVSACDPRGTVVTWPAPRLTSNGIPLAQPVICNPPSGSLFPVGVTTVHCEAFGSSTNRETASFTITVQNDGAGPGPGLDTNGNGLSDVWEIIFKAEGLAPGDDTDGDGLTNEQEAMAGTDPFDPTFRGGSYVWLAHVDRSALTNFAGRTIRLRIATVSHMGKFLQFQASSLPTGPWTNLSKSSHCEYAIDLGSTNLPAWLSKQAFFRVIVSDVDEDRDGVTAWEESILGTSDRAADTGLENDFGGWGNDWISGGTGQDGTNSTTSGGGGDDILIGGIMAYDQDCVRGGHGRDLLIGGLGSDLGTNSSSGYGGAGLDVLIGNTGGDRLSALDWVAAHLRKPQLREVALAHVGHGPGGSADARIVVAAGTGGSLDLSDWSMNYGTSALHRLTNSEPPLAGWNIHLDVLEPPQPSASALNPFVVGRIGADSNLWLSLRRADKTGQYTELDTVRFGTNENFRVCDYALAHQAVSDPNGGGERFLLVTPVIGFNSTNSTNYTHPDLYIIIWSVNVSTGRVTAIAVDPSDPVGHTNLPPKGTHLQIVCESDGRFMVSFLNRQAQLEYLRVEVSASGAVSVRQIGFLVEFDRPVDPIVTPDFALGGLNSNSFTTLLPGTNCSSRLLVWKDTAASCGANCDPALVLVTNRTATLLGSVVVATPPVNSFALCRLTDSLVVSAVVCGSNTVQLSAYSMVIDRRPSLVGQATNIITGLSPGASPHVKVFDGSRPMVIGSQFDVLTGRLEAGQLRLDRWRVPIESSK